MPFSAHLLRSPRLSGTIYLWMFWPSFNSAVTAHGDDQHRTALNTYYSLAACTLATYGMSAVTSHDGKLDMVRAADEPLTCSVRSSQNCAGRHPAAHH